jgi:hypothetical protein
MELGEEAAAGAAVAADDDAADAGSKNAKRRLVEAAEVVERDSKEEISSVNVPF